MTGRRTPAVGDPDSVLTPSHDGWVLQNADGVMIDVGFHGDTLFGWSADELLHEKAPVMLHPDDRPLASSVRGRVRVEGGAQSLQLRVRARNQRWLWVETEFRQASGPDGTVGERTCALLRDVSSRYLGHEAMSLLIELRELIESAPEVAQAWQFGLSRVGRLASFDEASVWERRSGVLAITHQWVGTGERSVVCSECDDGFAMAVADVWERAEHEWVVARPDRCRCGTTGPVARLLVPVLAGGQVVAVADFGRGLIEDDPTEETRLVVEVVGQLGDVIRRKTSEADLEIARRRFELAFSGAAIGMALVAPDGTFLQANDALCELLGRTHDELAATGFQSVTHPDDLDADLEFVRRTLAGEIPGYQMEKRYVRPDGDVVWALLSVSLVRDVGGAPVHFISQIQNITARKLAERRLRRSVARFRAAFDDSAVGMALVGLDGESAGSIVETNSELQRIASGIVDDLAGTPIFDLVEPGADLGFFDSMLALTMDDAAVRSEMPLRPVDGKQRWIRLVAAPVRYDDVEDGRFLVVQMEDITEQRRIQEEIAHQAMHDALTGLPNRVLMLDRIRRAQERSERSGQYLGVIFLDLDNFKDVNDTRGHGSGDRLLERVADRFRRVLRPNDTAARFGGDEFVIVCEDLSDDPVAAQLEATAIAGRLHAQLSAPIAVDGSHVWVSVSIGLHIVCGTHEPVRSILSSADTAMYQAKALGRSRTEVYDAAVRSIATERLEIAGELHFSVERDQLRVAYQPIVDLATGGRVGAEALLRWEHPTLGAVSPRQFIDIAEESDLIVDLGAFVVDQVCALMSRPDAPPGYVTINVSARQLSRIDFVAQLYQSLHGSGVDPAQLAVELTESVLVEASGSSRRQLAELREAGLRVGIDDFGTGYASLRYVKELPVTFLKIDRSFVAGLEHDHGDRMISSAVISLANALGLDTVAEGVETQAQVDILRELGCPHAQGYWFGRPAFVDD